MLTNRQYIEVSDPRSPFGQGIEMLNPWYVSDDDPALPPVPAEVLRRERALVRGAHAIRQEAERCMARKYPRTTAAYWKFTGAMRPRTVAEWTVIRWWQQAFEAQQEDVKRSVAAGVVGWQQAARDGIRRTIGGCQAVEDEREPLDTRQGVSYPSFALF